MCNPTASGEFHNLKLNKLHLFLLKILLWEVDAEQSVCYGQHSFGSGHSVGCPGERQQLLPVSSTLDTGVAVSSIIA